MTAKLIIGDVFDALATIPDGSVDLIITSPPFLALRSYLPADHPNKGKEIGSEPSPAEFIDTMLDVVEECRRVLAPHGSLVFELGDTYAGSGGAGGDYNEGGMREGQPRWRAGTTRADRPHAFRTKSDPATHGPGGLAAHADNRGNPDGMRDTTFSGANTRSGGGNGWPLDKSKVLIPQLFAVGLAYGLNPLTGRGTEPWRIRNVVAWCRPNPPVGADGDKFRAATSYLTIATIARDRYWDGDAVRVSSGDNTHARTAQGIDSRPNSGKAANDEARGGNFSTLAIEREGDGTRPMYDYWELSTQPYKGSHYATYPEMLVQPLVLSMCPERVCLECGEPSRRIVERESAGVGFRKSRENVNDQAPSSAFLEPSKRTTTGWTDCGHGGGWRPGVVLDPFAGSGTTLQVATRLGREAIGIDLDERNHSLIQERVGMFLSDVVYLSAPDKTKAEAHA